MWGQLLKLTIAAAGAYLAADVVSRLTTNKALHQHAFDWWNQMRDRILAWCKSNESLGVTRVIGYVTQVLDDAAVAAKRTMQFYAIGETKGNEPVVITEEVVSADELAKLFPELVGSDTVSIA